MTKIFSKKYATLFTCSVILVPSMATVAKSMARVHKKNVETVWTPSFYAITPRTDVKHPVSLNFCLTHTPNTLRTTISQITAKSGVRAENGVYIRYLHYHTTHKHGLGFNVVSAELWTVNAKGKKTWRARLWEYQQNLADDGVTNVVWATKQCKGKFIGVPETHG